MIIGIDGNEANVEKRVGIGEYAFELLQEFKQSQIPNLKFQIYLKSEPLSDMPIPSENWTYKIVKPPRLWTQIGLPFSLYFSPKKPDVFFSPSHYAPRLSPVPTVMSVMDLSYLHFPELFKASDLYQLKNWTAYSVRNAKKVLTISNASRNDIINQYKIPEENVVVTYPGIKTIEKMSSSKKPLIKDDYILFVGTLQPRKNIERLIEAFSKLKKNVKLVVVGKKGWLYESILAAPRKFNVEEKVVFMDFVSEADLQNLYSNAEFFILPSLYEGFGLPVLEAMQHGCAVVTSNVSSLPEVGGDAVLYVDPTNTEDIAEKMNTLLTDKELKEELIKKGFKQVKKFSWEKTARQTLEVLKEVASER